MKVLNKIAVITPIEHLEGVKNLLESKGEIFYLQHGSKQEVKKLLIEEKITAILCNPNKQGYKIDKELLEDSSVKIINTCSTGLNHIDLIYCEKESDKSFFINQRL